MGTPIADITEGADVSETKDRAAEVLRTKALGIGENHQEREGRELALSLLRMRNSQNRNLVRHLFIEIMGKMQWCVDKAEAAALENKSQQDVESPLGAFGEEWREIYLKSVVATALLEGVEVHCADVNRGTNAERMTERNNAIAQKVFDVAQTNFSGCLLLFGSDHFDGKETDNPLVPTICQNELLKDRMDWIKF